MVLLRLWLWTVRIEIIVWRSRILYMSSGTIIMKLWKIIQQPTNKTNLWSALQTRKLYWLKEAYRRKKMGTTFLDIFVRPRVAHMVDSVGHRFSAPALKCDCFLTFTVFRSITPMFDCLLYFFSSINCSLYVLKTLVWCYYIFVVTRFSFVSCATDKVFHREVKPYLQVLLLRLFLKISFRHPVDILCCWNSVFDVSWR